MQTKSVARLWMPWCLLSAIYFCAQGCTQQAASVPEGIIEKVAIHAEPWTYNDDVGALLHTAHYDIYTTVPSEDTRQNLANVMEGALKQYQRVAPGVPLTDQPMICYIFANREEWVQYTKRHMGLAANVYLQINRGGYTDRGLYVAYYIGEGATLSVAAHEGWHQFAYRHFKGRLPPFLEEGIATMFEDLRFEEGLPRWKLAYNRARLQSLQNAVKANQTFPLAQLMTLHAGNVVSESGPRIEAFYAQNWAFATFLWQADDGKYRAALRRILSDTADGSVHDPTGFLCNKELPWSPAGVQAMLEFYLGMPLAKIDTEYQKYIRKVAFTEFTAQWN